MAAITIQLPPQLARFVQQAVDEGRFVDSDDAIRTALRLLQRQDELDQAKLVRLRQLVQEGADSFERGDYEAIGVGGIGDFMNSVCLSAGPEAAGQ